MVKKKLDDEWSQFNEASAESIKEDAPSPEKSQKADCIAMNEVGIPANLMRIATAEDDLRKDYRLSACCLSCKYMIYNHTPARAFCFYPDHTARLGEGDRSPQRLPIIAQQRGWKRTSPIFVCNNWQRVPITRISTHIAWVNLDQAQVWTDPGDPEE